MNYKKYTNIIFQDEFNEIKNNLDTLNIVLRGFKMRHREYVLESFLSSISAHNPDNSYLIFEEEPDNEYDPNAMRVISKGEIFGTIAYVGKEFAPTVKEIVSKCDRYRICFEKDDIDYEKGVISALLFWI